MDDDFVGTVMSTFSFAAHARALATPRYPSFADPCAAAGPCVRAAGPEAGLLNRGPMHDDCGLTGGNTMTCRRFILHLVYTWFTPD